MGMTLHAISAHSLSSRVSQKFERPQVLEIARTTSATPMVRSGGGQDRPAAIRADVRFEIGDWCRPSAGMSVRRVGCGLAGPSAPRMAPSRLHGRIHGASRRPVPDPGPTAELSSQSPWDMGAGPRRGGPDKRRLREGSDRFETRAPESEAVWHVPARPCGRVATAGWFDLSQRRTCRPRRPRATTVSVAAQHLELGCS